MKSQAVQQNCKQTPPGWNRHVLDSLVDPGMDLNAAPEEGCVNGPVWRGALINYDDRYICRVESCDTLIQLPHEVIVDSRFPNPREFVDLTSRESFTMTVQAVHVDQTREWTRLLHTIWKSFRVAVLRTDDYEMVLYPPSSEPRTEQLEPVTVYYGRLPAGLPRKPASAPSPTAHAMRPQPGIHPRYLDSVAHTHSGWVFGGVAELIDNARDANASRLEIFMDEGQLPGKVEPLPMLCIADNGVGMTHEQMVRMLSFGHKPPDQEDKDQIGRFGVGFKTGSMRVGRDVLVMSQAEKDGVLTRSIGFLSQSYNAEREVLDAPIVTYRMKRGGGMEVDESRMTKVQAEQCMDAIATLSPFDPFRLGAEFSKIDEGEKDNEGNGGKTGTRIFIFNLRKDAGIYELDWESCNHDIMIRSKRHRSRPGQIATDVPLDYSLTEYLKVMFLGSVPRMLIFLQHKLVIAEKLACALLNPETVKGNIGGKPLEVTLGMMPKEKERGCCGFFLYWHGRLIEAYKRVGRMEYDKDIGLGVIGVIDVSPLMEADESGQVGVLNSKQGFDDTESYAQLLKWLADTFNKYWDTHYDTFRNELNVGENLSSNVTLVVEGESVQCDRCNKWRKLPGGYDPSQLPDVWFCFMEPKFWSCEKPQEEFPDGSITTAIGRGKERIAVSRAIVPTERATAGKEPISARQGRKEPAVPSSKTAEAPPDVRPGVNRATQDRDPRRDRSFSRSGGEGHRPSAKRPKQDES